MDKDAARQLPTYADWVYVEAFTKGDEQIIGALYQRCRDELQRRLKNDTRVSPEVRKDLMQAAFIELWRQAKNGQLYIDGNTVRLRCKSPSPSPPAWGEGPKSRTGQVTGENVDSNTAPQVTGKSVKSLVAYWVGIVANKCKEEVRFNARFTFLSEDDAAEPLPEVDETEAQLKERIISDCVAQMPPRCRQIITLFYYEHKTLDEILALRTAEKGERLSYNGLKTGKTKCMKQLMANIRKRFQEAGINVTTTKRKKS